jgi:signal transduction histidine kinase
MKTYCRLSMTLALLIWAAAPLVAQQRVADSLSGLLRSAASDKEKGRLHIRIAREYLSFDTVKAKHHLEQGLALAEQSRDDMGEGMYHLYASYMLCNRGAYQEGLKAFALASKDLSQFLEGKAVSAAERSEAEALLLDAELSQGNVLLELFEYEKAVEAFWRVLKQLEQANFPEKNAAMASTYQSIALAYYHRGQYQTALQYYQDAVPYANKSGNERVAAESQIYAAMCYTLIKKYDSSALWLARAEPIVLRSQDATLKTSFYARKAERARFMEQWQEAVNNYDRAIEHATVTSNVYMQASFSHAKARCLLKLNRVQEAREAGLSALSLARSIQKKREVLEAQRVLSMTEAAAGNYPAAYAYLDAYQQGSDSLHDKELTEKLQALDKKYKTAQKEEEILLLEQKNRIQELVSNRRKTLNYILAVGVVALLGMGALGYRNYRQKQRLQQHRISELETEKKLMATEAVLKGEEQERTRLAKDLHDGLGGMLSGIKYSLNTMKGNLVMTPENAQAYERSMDMLDSSIREMRRVAHNMMPEVLLRYGLDAALKDYTAEINKSGILRVVHQSMGEEKKDLERSTMLALYRIVQELLNNAVKHAAASEVLVQMFWQNGKLVVNVEDNGKGFDPSKVEQSGGMGWRNIRSRVELLNGNMDVQSAPGKGTSVNLEFLHI